MTGLEIITDVSADLNDQEIGYEFSRWTKPQLQSYLKEALVQIGSVLKSWFTDTVIEKVEPGELWHKLSNGLKVKRVIGECDREGNVFRYLSPISDDEHNIWAGLISRCPSSPSAELVSYSVNATTRESIRLFPENFSGIHYLLIEVYAKASGALDAEVPDDAIAMAKQWMLYRALSVDIENNQSISAVAQQHYKTFSELLKMAIEIDRYEEQQYGTVRTIPNDTTRQVS